jgi:outer membrane protein
MNIIKKIICLTFALGLVCMAYGQDVMSLKDCMQYAIENSAKMKIQQMDVDDARVARRDAILNTFTPNVSAGTYAYSNFGRSVDPETNTYVSTTSFNNGYQVGAGITLFNGFSAVNNMKISKTALKMGINQEELTRDEICLATMEAYYNVVYFQQLSDILESQVQTAQDALTLARKQEELGQKGYSDVIEMEAELADCEYQLINAKNQQADALLILKDLMFWPMDEELLIDTSMANEEVIATLPHYF